VSKKRWMGTPPEKCDLCEKKLEEVFVDGKTKQGPWGILCSKCHAKYGCGLGEGLGQKYNLKTKEKLEG